MIYITIYILGALVWAFICGVIDYGDGYDDHPVAIGLLWPLIIFVVLIILPFAFLYKLGTVLKKK